MDELNETLRALNDNVARLAVAQFAFANELYMLRKAYDSDTDYDDPIENVVAVLGIDGNIAPEFFAV